MGRLRSLWNGSMTMPRCRALMNGMSAYCRRTGIRTRGAAFSRRGTNVDALSMTRLCGGLTIMTLSIVGLRRATRGLMRLERWFSMLSMTRLSGRRAPLGGKLCGALISAVARSQRVRLPLMSAVWTRRRRMSGFLS
nr:MAG TPA: hypothetical protein [Caudoviricetes sp.]